MGEESLFDRRSPEARVFTNNRKALDISNNPFNKPYKIAVSIPISWNNGFENAREVLLGVAMAQQEWNAEHQNTQILVLVADDGFDVLGDSNDDPGKDLIIAEEVATELVKNKDVLGVIGHFTSDTTEHTARIYKENGVVLISPVSTAVRCPLDDQGDPIPSNPKGDCLELNDYVFRTSINEREAIDKLLGYVNLKREDITKIAIIYEENSRYSRLYKKEFNNLVQSIFPDGEIQVVNPDNGVADKCNVSELNNFNPDPCFSLIKEEKVDTLLLIPSTENNYWVEVAIEQNRVDSSDEKRPYSILGSDSMYQQGFIRVNDKDRPETEDMLVPISWHRTLSGEDNECSQDSEELECKAAKFFYEYGDDSFKPLGINWRTATSYDAAKALFGSIEDASRSNGCLFSRYIGQRSTCIKGILKNHLREVNISGEGETSFGSIGFNELGDREGIDGAVVSSSKGNFIISPDSSR